MDKLTDRQLDVLLFIWDFIERRGYPPTYREIAGDYGFWLKAAYDHVAALLRKGYLVKYDPDRQDARNIRLTGKLGFDGREYYTRVEVQL